ncbi:hypothetical protein CRENBAI_010534 [Crenichthys baileyi]|uniref:C2H2-type domain-containing protein n=1 Tax=Crenichthys baileyi TaxID=28760 RepID=A0AAV9SJC0_9TELE
MNHQDVRRLNKAKGEGKYSGGPNSNMHSVDGEKTDFTQQENLNVHFSHSVKCSVCNGLFTDKDSLVEHMRSHTRQTRFQCSVRLKTRLPNHLNPDTDDRDFWKETNHFNVQSVAGNIHTRQA